MLVPHNSVLSSSVDGGIGAGFSLVVVFGLLFVAARQRLVGATQRYLGVAMFAALLVYALNGMFIDMSLGSTVSLLVLTMVGMFLSTAGRLEPAPGVDAVTGVVQPATSAAGPATQ